jgi:hypothetical protein
MIATRKSRIIIASMILMLLLVACGAEAGQPVIDVILYQPEANSAELILSDDHALIDVTDGRGINGLTATLVEGEWPQRITIHLRLKGLERLEIHYGPYTIATGKSSNDSPDPPLILYVADEDGKVTQAPVSSFIYFPDISRTEDGFDVTLPAHFFQEQRPAFSVHWIDFYR